MIPLMTDATAGPPSEPPVPESIADRYRRLAAHLGDTVGSVNLHAWTDPSPCEGWSALDVLRHLIDTNGLMLALVGDELWPGPPVGGDPLGAWISASDQVQARLDNPSAAGAPVEGEEGLTFEGAVDQFLGLDLVVHRWDIAAATGGDTVIDPADLEGAWVIARALGDDLRAPGVCGPALDPPIEANEQERLLAFLGRRSW